MLRSAGGVGWIPVQGTKISPATQCGKKESCQGKNGVWVFGEDLLERLRRARLGKISVVSGDDGEEEAELAWNLLKSGRQEPAGVGGAVLRKRY